MGKLWTLIIQLHSIAGYTSMVAIESPSKMDDEQWLAYWIIYSFLTLAEMLLQPILEWIPIWYDVKLLMMAWLVLPQFTGAAYLYERFVREHTKIWKICIGEGEHDEVHQNLQQGKKSPNGGKAKKFVDFITSKKGDEVAY